MKCLVMGGTHHVGRAVMETAVIDTWTWLERDAAHPPRPNAHSPAQWFDPVQEQHILESSRASDRHLAVHPDQN